VSDARSVEGLLEARDRVVDDVAKAEGRYREAGGALVTYGRVLDRVQSEADGALRVAKEAASEVAEAERLVGVYERRAGEALAQERLDDYQRYQRLVLVQRERMVAGRERVVVQGRVVEGVVADRDRAAGVATDRIEGVVSGDGLNDSWWDRWGEGLVSFIAGVAELVAMVAGVLALVLCWVPGLGQLLLVVAGLAGLVAALANIEAYAKLDL
jgi:hypothetical protein